MRKTICVVALLTVTSLITVPPASAAGWNWDLGIYLWALGMDGSMTVRGQEADVDIGFSDIFDNLDLALSAHVEANKRDSRWGWFFDLYWADLGKEFEQVTGEFDMQMAYVELAGDYDLSQDFQAFLGLRYTSMDLTLEFDPEIPVPPQIPTRVDGSQSWTDLMVGGRWKADLGERWRFWVRGDLAGFGISSSSDLTWNVMLMGHVMISKRFAFVFGYRWLDIDYVNEDDDFAMDVRQEGPVLAFNYSFY